MVAGLILEAATRIQIFVATQSPALLDYFEAQDIVVVDRKERNPLSSASTRRSFGSGSSRTPFGAVG